MRQGGEINSSNFAKIGDYFKLAIFEKGIFCPDF